MHKIIFTNTLPCGPRNLGPGGWVNITPGKTILIDDADVQDVITRIPNGIPYDLLNEGPRGGLVRLGRRPSLLIMDDLQPDPDIGADVPHEVMPRRYTTDFVLHRSEFNHRTSEANHRTAEATRQFTDGEE